MIKLNLFSNNLAGPLPSELGQLSALQGLYLFNNKLTGPIPAELGQLQALAWLKDPAVGAHIPAQLRQLEALRSLYLHTNPRTNQLSGQEALSPHLQEHNPECSFYC